MATTHPVSPPVDRTGRRRLVLVGLAIILVFAAIGVVSAGIFVGSQFTSSAASPRKAAHTTPVPASLRDVRRAQAQATRIVAQAQKNARATARGVTARARTQATALVVSAKKRAGAIAAAVPTAAPAPAAPTIGNSAPSAAPPSAPATGVPSTGATGSTSASGTPDLSAVPASWKVVAYNASLGTGSGIGTVTVLNRSGGTFSGTVKIAYARGGAAYASFSGLGPGQSEVLALSGTPYPGGGYTILLPSVH